MYTLYICILFYVICNNNTAIRGSSVPFRISFNAILITSPLYRLSTLSEFPSYSLEPLPFLLYFEFTFHVTLLSMPTLLN